MTRAITKKAVPSGQKKARAGQIVVAATNAEYAQLCRKSLKRLPVHLRSRLSILSLSDLGDATAQSANTKMTLIVSRLSDLTAANLERAWAGAATKQLLFLEGLPVEAVATRLLRLNIRNPHRLHIVARSSVVDLVYRLVSGVAQGGATDRDSLPPPIVDAWVENQHLVLLSPSFDRLEVPFDKLARYIGENPSKIGSFEIDDDGRHLYWPHADAHFGWNQFRQLVDPAAALADMQKTSAFNVKYGTAIRALREEVGLKQSDIQGVTERQLRRVEHGEQSASKATLGALAKSHGISLEDYLSALAKRLTKDS